jgi:hypothetical protein
MDSIRKTYIVCHSTQVNKLKQIKHFKMDLGMAIVNKQNMFQPQDMFIQKHYLFYGDIIHSLGSIGALPVYSQNQLPSDCIMFCNEAESFKYKLMENLSIYDNINTGLDLFFKKIGINNNVSTEKTPENTESKPAAYVAPNKPMSEYTEAERIAFMRSGAANRLPKHLVNKSS